MKRMGIGFVSVLLICCGMAHAEILVTQVLYDPDGADTGLEWVELYNTLDIPVALSGYSLWSGDGSTEGDWTLEWTGTGETIPAKGYFLIGEEVTPADVVTALDLQNGPDAVRIQKEGVTVGTLGWGAHTFPEFYETTPSPLAGSGMALARVGSFVEGVFTFEDIGDNSLDFQSAPPSPRNSSTKGQAAGIEIILQVDDARPTIRNLTMEDDLNDTGTQVLPLPGGNRSVGVSAIINYAPGIDGISKVALSWEHGEDELFNTTSGTSSFYHGSLSVPFDIPPGDYLLKVITYIGDVEAAQSEMTFTILPVTGLEIDTDRLLLANLTKGQGVLVEGDTSMGTIDRPTLRNIGNRPLDISVKATPFQGMGSMLDLSSLSCRVGDGDTFQVREQPMTLGVGLASGRTMAFSLAYTVPESAGSGTYKGSILIGAVSG